MKKEERDEGTKGRKRPEKSGDSTACLLKIPTPRTHGMYVGMYVCVYTTYLGFRVV